MSVISRASLEASPLADLHQLAAELKIDGFRRLRKSDLIGVILERQGIEDVPTPVADLPEADADSADDDAATTDDDEAPRPRSRGRRGGRTRRRAEEDGATDEDAGADAPPAVAAVADAASSDEDDEQPTPARSRGGRGRGRDRDRDRGERNGGDRDRDADRDDAPAEDRIAEGTVELLANGSGFVRVAGPEPSEDDVYISAAQIRRCELVAGDTVTGPVRRPRRSERYPSLVRIDTINGAPADEVAEGTPYEELPAGFPSERLALGSEDPTLKAIEWLTPIGRGSRVTITGGSGAGKSEALRLLGEVLSAQEELEVAVVLTGVRPEELQAWKGGPTEVAGALSFAASPEALGQALERAIETSKRVAARGGHAVLLVDTLDFIPAVTARRLLAAARNLEGAGSLTIVATSSVALGGETTVIALDPRLALSGRFPALDLGQSATLRPDLLVGEAGADAIAQARAQALGL